MLEDKLLVLRCKGGSREAMCRIYRKHKDFLLTVARALLNEKTAAEDVVHDVFVSFAESVGTFELTGSLRGYLATCAANLARDRMRAKENRAGGLDLAGQMSSGSDNPEEPVIEQEESGRVREALGQLPYEQREVVVMHLNGGMKFRELAKLQGVSINTVQGRYRYGLNKLRSLLDSEVTK